MNEEIVIRGTEMKLNIHIDPIDGVSMEDYDFHCEAYVMPGKSTVIVHKNDMVKVDKDNYILLVDTSKLNPGELYIRVTAQIPDSDFKDHIRTEIACIHTNINIRKC